MACLSAVAAASDEPDSLIGTLGYHRTLQADTLVDLACHYGLGFLELVAANPGVDPWLPGADVDLVLPTLHVLPDAPHRGIIINLSEQRLYYFPPPPGRVRSFPVGIGREGWETPVGETEVVGKRARPTWRPPASIRAERPELPAAIGPGPHNPLGPFALDLGWTNYVIHGTNKPPGVGRRVSHGCIRLYNHDIAWLFERVAVGTPVVIVDQPAKLGWFGGELYLEVHPTQTQADELEMLGRITPDPAPESLWRILKAAGDESRRLDWPLVQRVVQERRGIPVQITK